MTDEERKKQPKKRVQCELHCRECGKLLGKIQCGSLRAYVLVSALGLIVAMILFAFTIIH